MVKHYSYLLYTIKKLILLMVSHYGQYQVNVLWHHIICLCCRCGHLDTDPKEVSPVFTQFLECVWQLSEQFPCVFEFNERYLIEIHNQVYACQYGNFIGNCQKERLDMRWGKTARTHSDKHACTIKMMQSALIVYASKWKANILYY